MVAVPIPHPSQTPGYRGRFQESFGEPFPPREYSYGRPAAAPEPAPVAETVAAPNPSAAPAETPMLAAFAEGMKDQDWVGLLAAGTLMAGGALLVSGKKRAGLLVAAAGTALALMEEKEAIESLWKKLPGYLREAQNFVDKAEVYLKDAGITS